MLIDYDYVGKLSEKDKQWLNKFTEEYTNARFKPVPSQNLHKNKAMRKDCYDRNNARNRDILTKAITLDKLVPLDTLDTENQECFDEDSMIERMDNEFKD